MLESLKEINVTEKKKKMLVFCSSIDTAHRLTRLLQYFFLAVERQYAVEDGTGENLASSSTVRVQEFSSLLLQKDRDAML